MFRVTVSLCAFALVLSGCAHSVKVMKFSEDLYPPTDDGEVLQTEPVRSHTNMAQLSVRPGDDAVLKLVAKAKEIGADAIVLLGEKTDGAVAVPVGSVVFASPVNKVVAVAIKYR